MLVPPFTGNELTRATEMLDYASALIRRTCGGQVLEQFLGRQEEFAASSETSIFLSQRPVTDVTEITENAVPFTDFEWDRGGELTRNDGTSWSVGPIVITYDGGYLSTDDEIVVIRGICIEAAARAITKEAPPFETMGEPLVGMAGMPPRLGLTAEEQIRLQDFGPVGVG